MPTGFFTVEKWTRKKAGATWIPIFQLDSHHSLSEALEALKQRGRTGLYRIVQTQRCIWAEMKNGKLSLHGSHASSPKSLAQLTKIFEKEKGRRPVEKARQERLRAKRSKIG